MNNEKLKCHMNHGQTHVEVTGRRKETVQETETES